MARNKNSISLPSAAFVTIFECFIFFGGGGDPRLEFHVNLETAEYIPFEKLDNSKTNYQFTSPQSFKEIENREGKFKQGFQSGFVVLNHSQY